MSIEGVRCNHTITSKCRLRPKTIELIVQTLCYLFPNNKIFAFNKL